ncbi:DUF397 domain-containing protein [Actinokineospora sp. G85]|uniref:DUF397 domain-containing protein n=1 Tax=Actinokineospora sp. G85 TaxID=3406626 RepID=UPI003C748710
MTPVDHLAWRTSTRSSNGESCVEVAPTADGAIIRHSKHPDAGTIAFPLADWTAFLHDTLDGSANTNGVATITKIGTNTVVTSHTTGVALRYDADEWSAFLAGANDGEFDFTGDHLTAS